MTGTVFNIQRYCTNDGPGIRTTVFLKGCPLDCLWCHNPESKSARPQILLDERRCLRCGGCAASCRRGCHSLMDGRHLFSRERCVACGACASSCSGALELVGSEQSVEEVLVGVMRDKPFYGAEGGMTVSGGEPFAQADFLLALLAAAKKQGIGTAVETSGFADAEDIRASLPFVDWYLYDCKETDAGLHKKWTGVDNERILSNLSILNEANAPVILRCPIVPGCNDRADHFSGLGELSRRQSCIRRIEIMPYHPMGVRKAVQMGLPSSAGEISFPTESEIISWEKALGATAACPVCRGS